METLRKRAIPRKETFREILIESFLAPLRNNGTNLENHCKGLHFSYLCSSNTEIYLDGMEFTNKRQVNLLAGCQNSLVNSASFFKWAIPGLFFFIFVFSIQLTVNVQYKFLLMTRFEPRTSGIGSYCSTN